jgi:hypothetical protein
MKTTYWLYEDKLSLFLSLVIEVEIAYTLALYARSCKFKFFFIETGAKFV